MVKAPLLKEFKQKNSPGYKWRIEKDGYLWDLIFIGGNWIKYLVMNPFKDIQEIEPTEEEYHNIVSNNKPIGMFGYSDFLNYCNKFNFEPKRLFGIIKWIHLYDNDYRVHFNVNRMGSNSSFKIIKVK